MTEEQVNRTVRHLCEQLHVAVRLKGTEALPPNARDIGFDTASVKTVLLSGLRLAGATVQKSIEGAEEPLLRRARDRSPAHCHAARRSSAVGLNLQACGR
jgi:hypothetical protein